MGMGQSLLMSIMRVTLYFIAIFAILFSLLFLYRGNLSSQYISQCNEIITRSGGLTQEAYDKCNRLSQKYYHNYYHVSATPNFNRTDAMMNASDKGFNEYNPVNKNNGVENNYSKSEAPFGQQTNYYLYSDVPIYGHVTFSSGKFTTSPVHETVASAIRAGSQY